MYVYIMSKYMSDYEMHDIREMVVMIHIDTTIGKGIAFQR